MVRFRYTAICTDSDAEGSYKHIVRRVESGHYLGERRKMLSAVSSFTAKANRKSRTAPAQNHLWEIGLSGKLDY